MFLPQGPSSGLYITFYVLPTNFLCLVFGNTRRWPLWPKGFVYINNTELNKRVVNHGYIYVLYIYIKQLPQ